MNDNYGKKVIISFAAIVLINLQQFILLPVISRSMGIEIYGVWSQINVAINFILPIALFALPQAFVRFSAGQNNNNEISKNYYTIFFIILISSVFFTIIFFLLSPFIKLNFIETEKPILETIKLSSLLIIVYALNQYSSNYFRTFQREKIYSALQIFQTVIVFLLLLLIILYDYGLNEFVLSLVLVYALVFIICQFIIFKEIGISKPDLKMLKPFFLFSIPLIPISLLNWVINLSDRYIIGHFFSVVEVAKYSAAYTLAMVIQLYYAPFYFLLFPKLTELLESKNYSTFNKVIHYSNKLPLLVAIPSIFAFLVLYKDLFKLILGSSVNISIFLLPAISLGYIFYLTGSFYDHILILFKKTKYSLYGNSLAAIINVIGNIILVPIIGIIGAAIVTMITFLMQFIYFLFQSRRYYKIKLDWRFISKSIIASMLMSLCIIILKPFLVNMVTLGSFSVLIFCGVIVYLLLLKFLNVFEKDEIEFIKSLVSIK